MKYFIIALLFANSLNAMRFDEKKAEETAKVITTTLGLKAPSTPEKKSPQQQKQEKSDQNTPKTKL